MMALFSIEAEQEILGSILDDPSIIDRVSDKLESSDFYSPDHISIFSAMIGAQAEGGHIDAITISERNRDIDIGYLAELQSNSTGKANFSYYASVVKDKAKKRQLIDAVNQIAETVHKGDAEKSDALIADAAAIIGGLQVSDGAGIRGTEEVLKSLAEKWQRRIDLKGEVDGLETGLGLLDQRFRGWKAGDLIFIGARPSMGKSVLAFQIGCHNAVMHRKNVLGFSLEMTAEQVLERLTANLGGVHLGVFKRCDNSEFGRHNDQILVAANKLKNARIKIDDTPGLHINQILARARAAHRREKLDMVIVDHIHIVKGDGQSREREIAGITGSLKILAKELACPVIAVGQLNRSVEKRPDKKPMMSDLRDSGSVEQDADIVMLLYREEYYDPNTTEKGILEVITAKYREGEIGVDFFDARLECSKIQDLPYLYTPQQKAPQKRGGLD